jgi:hypothetical protein
LITKLLDGPPTSLRTVLSTFDLYFEVPEVRFDLVRAVATLIELVVMLPLFVLPLVQRCCSVPFT